MKNVFALLLLSTALSANAKDAKDAGFSPLETQAWTEQCASVYGGDDASCKCLLDKQVSKLGMQKVKINLLNMVSNLPDATEEQITKSDADALALATTEEKLNAAKDEFQTNLDANLETCIK